MTTKIASAPVRRFAPAKLLFGVVLLLIGAWLDFEGAKLIGLGGSPYYVAYGSLLLGAGALFILGRPAACWVSFLAYGLTLVWSFSEAGLHYWPLIPRLIVPTILVGVALLLLPTFPTLSGRRGAIVGSRVTALLLVLALIGAGLAAFQPKGAVFGSAGGARNAMPVNGAGDWISYGRTLEARRFAPFDQISRDNVNKLKVAWTFRSGDLSLKSQEDENTPLQVGDTIYSCSRSSIVHALDVETGKVRWTFDGHSLGRRRSNRCRGLSYYSTKAETASVSTASSTAECANRIVLTTPDARLFELDAKTGAQCRGFGDRGVVDLSVGMGDRIDYYYLDSASIVARNLIIVGGCVQDNAETNEPSGVIRAFDARTGELVWAWDLGDPAITKLPPTGRTYTRGTPNMWSTPSFDDKSGLLYIPTGNATPDFVAWHRKPEWAKYSSAVVALDINTGRERWVYQTVHRDLWDYDVPSQPALYDLPDGHGGVTPVLIQTTKSGQIFMLNRLTGRPVADVVERPAPQKGSPDLALSPTQPFSVGMPTIGMEPLSEARMWGASLFDQLLCRVAFRASRYDGVFTPPGTKRSIEYPGYYGGMNWGSVSIDEQRGYLIVNDIRVPDLLRLVPRDQTKAATKAWIAGQNLSVFDPQWGTPYGIEKTSFMSPLHVPCQQPPWGTMSAIDLKTRKLVWQTPMGTIRDIGFSGIKAGLPIPTGMPTIGGALTTGGGLTFFAGTQDYFLRAMNTDTGREVWKARLPVGSQGTPISFIAPTTGRQFIVLAVGGARQSPDRGDYLIAYALPAQDKPSLR